MANRADYAIRLKQRGNNARERALHYLKNDLLSNESSMLSMKQVTWNNNDINLIIDSTETASVKNFKALNREPIDYGDYIIWNGIYWIVNSRDYDDEVYVRGQMTQCNYKLKWQNESLETIERWAVFSIVTRYNEGVYKGRQIDDIQSTISVILPGDSETCKLKRNKRFLADIYTEEPYAWEITQRDVLSNNYSGDRGLITLALSQDLFNDATDNKDLMIADYKEPTNENEIDGNNYLIVGRDRTYTSNSPCVWNITDGNEYVKIISSNANEIVLVAENKSDIGKTVILSNGSIEKHLTIKSLY